MNTVSQEIDSIIKKYDDWRGKKLAQIRKLIKEADPDIIEEVKWKKPSNPDGVPVWSHDGIICLGETYNKHLRISFAKGPELDDPKSIINSYRAILIHEEDKIDEAAFKALIRAAIKLNHETKNKPKTKKTV
jgi:hypothetical protein